MSVHELLDALRRSGVTLESQGDRLQVIAPRGVLTEAVRLRLAEHKPELLALLAGETAAIDIVAENGTVDRFPVLYPLEVRWAAERGWLQVRDCHTGAWHEVPARECPPSWLDAARRARNADRC